MKKVLNILLAFVSLCVLAYWFWPGKEPNLPKAGVVQEIRLIQGQDEVTINQSEEIEVFLEELENANKTRQESVHDAPLVSPHVRITFISAEDETPAFVYEGRLGNYLELPYVGIYKLKDFPKVIQDMLAV